MTSPSSTTRPAIDQKLLFRRFRQTAFSFRQRRGAFLASAMVALIVLVALMQVGVQYLISVWTRDFFNALESRRAHLLWHLTGEFVVLASASVVLMVASVWSRMLAQRGWRAKLTRDVMRAWLANDHFRHLDPLRHGHENPEFRIAEDVRVATEAPVDLGMALFISALTATTFFEVLWEVGGGLSVRAFGLHLYLPAYLVIGVVMYALMVTGGTVWVGRRLTGVIQDKNQAEAEFRAAATLLREIGEGTNTLTDADSARGRLRDALPPVLLQWQELSRQLMRITWVTHSAFLLTPVVALFLCAPKYLAGSMSLGELTQASAAFGTVVGAFNWVVDNFQRLADWTSSVDRVATLLLALDEVSATDGLASDLSSPPKASPPTR